MRDRERERARERVYERQGEIERENERQRDKDSGCERNFERDTARDHEWITVRNRKRERQRGWKHLNEGLGHRHGGRRQRRVDEQRSHYQVNWRDKSDVTTFYFTRFPEEASEKQLWFHFKQLGDVREVFIPRQRNKQGRRYGFVRFVGISNVSHMERKLDNMIVGGLKLHVNIPKYGRGRKEKDISGACHKGYKEGDILRRNMAAEQNMKRSYAEVVTSYEENKERKICTPPLTMTRGRTHSSITLEISEETKNRYAHTWVGRLKKPQVFERVDEDLSWNLGAEVSSKYLGDDWVLLIGLSDTKAHDLITEESNHGTTVFYEMMKWNPKLKPTTRLTWVQCWGIPLVAWSIDHIRQIVAEVGDLIEVDENFEDMQRLDRARVLVRTPRLPIVEHTVMANIGGDDYTISIVEENCNEGVACARQRQSVWGSSEEILSVGDDTDTMQSWPTDSSPPITTFETHGDNPVRQRLVKSIGQRDSPLDINRSREDQGLGKAISHSEAVNGNETNFEEGNLGVAAENITALESQPAAVQCLVSQKGEDCLQRLLPITEEDQIGVPFIVDQGLVGETFQNFSNGSEDELLNKSRDMVDLVGPNPNMGLHRSITPLNQGLSQQEKPASTLQVYSRKKGLSKKRAQVRGKQINPKILDFAENPSNHNHNAASCSPNEALESPKQHNPHQSSSSAICPNKNEMEDKEDDYRELAKELGVVFADANSSGAEVKTDMGNIENPPQTVVVLGYEDNAP
ncbi:hypothetical protein GYH30_009799 [Glycine max]|uniref:RRM domain-containing protein n=1 Tax=Glycine max TaxID=3847 RepID=K7KJW7_SOYBN|nr:hypothetical protein GYH30_009799 [Glycine max]